MKNLHCKMFGHDLKVTREVTLHVKEFACKQCKKEFTTSSNGNLIELTSKYKEINRVLEHIRERRTLRKSRQLLNTDLLVFKH